MQKNEMDFGFRAEIAEDGSVVIPKALRILEGFTDGRYEIRVEGDKIILRPLAGRIPDIPEPQPPCATR